MRVGSIVKHKVLGVGKVIEFCKYSGVIVNYSNDEGILVRVSHIDSLELIDE